MEAGDVVWLLVILFWLFSSFVSWLGKNLRRQKAKKPKPVAPPPRPGVSTPAPQPVEARGRRPPPPPSRQAASPEDALTSLLKRLGVDLQIPAQEPPVASEHAHTPGWHERTASEIRPTAAEHGHTPGWHERTASEVGPTSSEQTLVASEHRSSAGEHRAGDVRRSRTSGLPPVPVVEPAAPRPGFGRRTVATLRNRDALARAIVLKEILGPPVGLRNPDERP